MDKKPEEFHKNTIDHRDSKDMGGDCSLPSKEVAEKLQDALLLSDLYDEPDTPNASDSEKIKSIDDIKMLAKSCNFPELQPKEGQEKPEKTIAVLYSGNYDNSPGTIGLHSDYQLVDSEKSGALASHLVKHQELARDLGLSGRDFELITIGDTKEGKEIEDSLQQLKDAGVEVSDAAIKEIWKDASREFAKQANTAAERNDVAILCFVANARDSGVFKDAEESQLTSAFVLSDAPLTEDGKPANSVDARFFQLDDKGRVIQH